jgi:hypothetical protein
MSGPPQSGNPWQPGQTVRMAPPLSVEGFPIATAAEVGVLRQQQSIHRYDYWAFGPGARLFLERVAATINASEHMYGKPFEIALTDVMRASIASRVTTFAEADGEELERVIMGYAAEVGQAFLGNLVRAERWRDYDLQGRVPLPFSRPTYTGGQSVRGTGLYTLMPRISDGVLKEQFNRLMMENNLL